MHEFKDYMLKKYGNDEGMVGKWDVVLFCGNYNPITIDEYIRILQFTDSVVRNPDYNEYFSDNVEYGLLTDLPDEGEIISNSYNLSLEEREFITGRFFGLKLFPINFRKLMWLMLPVPDEAKLPVFNKKFTKKTRIEEKYGLALEKLKEYFDNTNILIVFDPDDQKVLPRLDKIITNFESDDISVGFLAWSHHGEKHIPALNNVPITPEIIKAVVLMDYFRPDPEELKSFAYKYRLGEHLDSIRTIHFKVGGEKYLDVFTLLFPRIILFDEDEENIADNYKVVMEMLKKMYLEDEYSYLNSDDEKSFSYEDDFVNADAPEEVPEEDDELEL